MDYSIFKCRKLKNTKAAHKYMKILDIIVNMMQYNAVHMNTLNITMEVDLFDLFCMFHSVVCGTQVNKTHHAFEGKITHT
jgi:hypothetical protein